MQIIVPDYYKNFKCIAQKCKHSCCIGWEIDIDPDTLDFYLNIQGKWRKRFKKSISLDGEAPHFITDEKGRCPFLNKNGLCDIISELGGEESLCQICYDHPRFYNYFGSREEIGLGICCEAAAKLILSNDKKVTLTALEEYEDNTPSVDEEKAYVLERDTLFSTFQNRKISLKQRINRAAELYKLSPLEYDIAVLVKKYRALERLDSKWDEMLNKTEQKGLNLNLILAEAEQKIPLPAEQLLCYFTYRYFVRQALVCNQKRAVDFIIEATCFCLSVCLSNFDELNLENFAEICRIFSLEVEYSEQNVDLLLKGGN